MSTAHVESQPSPPPLRDSNVESSPVHTVNEEMTSKVPAKGLTPAPNGKTPTPQPRNTTLKEATAKSKAAIQVEGTPKTAQDASGAASQTQQGSSEGTPITAVPEKNVENDEIDDRLPPQENALPQEGSPQDVSLLQQEDLPQAMAFMGRDNRTKADEHGAENPNPSSNPVLPVVGAVGRVGDDDVDKLAAAQGSYESVDALGDAAEADCEPRVTGAGGGSVLGEEAVVMAEAAHAPSDSEVAPTDGLEGGSGEEGTIAGGAGGGGAATAGDAAVSGDVNGDDGDLVKGSEGVVAGAGAEGCITEGGMDGVEGKVDGTNSALLSGAAVEEKKSSTGDLKDEPVTPEECNLFVGDLARNLTEEKLQDAFQQFGKVLSVSIKRDRTTGKNLGYGFVKLSSHKEAVEAKKSMQGADLGGRCVRVGWAQKNTSLYVGGLEAGVTEEALTKEFSRFGPLEKELTSIKPNGKFGFVKFRYRVHAENAKRELNNRPAFNGLCPALKIEWNSIGSNSNPAAVAVAKETAAIGQA
ncbi:unnamed protein product, partial [Discosporangium mesarthrocarpum]